MEQFGPWRFKSLEKTWPAISGCACLRACKMSTSGTGSPGSGLAGSASPPGSANPSTSSPELPGSQTSQQPTSTATDLPTSGYFAKGSVHIVGLEPYHWTSEIELGFRQAIADTSSNIPVQYVDIVAIVSAEKVGTKNGQVAVDRKLLRRRLAQEGSVALEVQYRVYVPTEEQGKLVSEAIDNSIRSGELAVRARRNGFSSDAGQILVVEKSEVVYVEEATKTSAPMMTYGIAAGGVLVAALVVCGG